MSSVWIQAEGSAEEIQSSYISVTRDLLARSMALISSAESAYFDFPLIHEWLFFVYHYRLSLQLYVITFAYALSIFLKFWEIYLKEMKNKNTPNLRERVLLKGFMGMWPPHLYQDIVLRGFHLPLHLFVCHINLKLNFNYL